MRSHLSFFKEGGIFFDFSRLFFIFLLLGFSFRGIML